MGGEPGSTVSWKVPGKSVSKEEASEKRAGDVRPEKEPMPLG